MVGIDEHMDVVVVGSGFGGSVAAYRFAEAGRDVVVLERGRVYPPGDFPRTPAEMARNLWDPSNGLHGMFDVWSFKGIDAVVSSGLGGGSLIYANVLLRKDERWFVHEQPIPGGGYENWPVTRADLEPHYDRVERMIGVRPYPFGHPPFNRTPKTRAMADAAGSLGLQWQLPPLAVSFAPSADEPPAPGQVIPEPAYGNLHGVPRRTCRLCGECDIGCNDGAKNSLDHNYLSAARHQGAQLRDRHEVRGIAPRPGGGYEVRYVVHDDPGLGRPRDTSRLPEQVLTCDRLVLAAGTLGSTWLLLRNRERFGGLGRALGTRFSGNGDLLGFALRARTPDGAHRPLRGSQGPVITSAIRVPDRLDSDDLGGDITGRGHYVQDAGYPGFADWLMESSQWPGYLRRGVLIAAARARRRFSRTPGKTLGGELNSFLGRNDLSDGSLPLLGMGRDVPDGVLRVERDRLAADWITGTSRSYFAGVESTMRNVAGALGGTLRTNPLGLVGKVITVHPLGGAPMGRYAGEGVVDAYGEVFGFPGLYVADGAALPGPVGPNPSLTIAALADRMCDHALSAAPRPAAVPAAMVVTAPESPATSLTFTEEMKGFVGMGVADPRAGARVGRQRRERLSVRLTITVDDVEEFVADPRHQARADGWVDRAGRRTGTRGWFNLFVREGDDAARYMRYGLHFTDEAGRPMTFDGRKEIVNDPGPDLWQDTTTLFVRLVAGHLTADQLDAAPVLGAGIITIHPADFFEQLTTFRVAGPEPIRAAERFGRLFAGELWDVYGAWSQAAVRR